MSKPPFTIELSRYNLAQSLFFFKILKNYVCLMLLSVGKKDVFIVILVTYAAVFSEGFKFQRSVWHRQACSWWECEFMGLYATLENTRSWIFSSRSLGKINFTPFLVLEESFWNVSFWEFILDLILTPVEYLQKEVLLKVLSVWPLYSAGLWSQTY